ncbi:putative GATA-binding transcription factor [Cavenderia fasciculata]|uniref:GATA-binding transcription factor n=1 Tax=Cavenderia fasciculata TaxID=261658 RepID=F4PRE1_CACFS|nr:putative GATA-binding transcription factor [Cavenderia fasciculata]EGG20493.1 putative GATA-binding transcription factor [Cavenderia fasciculata]|eukprot:XP_004358343.1 putative GATA-binding transcription factor [Cavenderia fasciculata]
MIQQAIFDQQQHCNDKKSEAQISIENPCQALIPSSFLNPNNDTENNLLNKDFLLFSHENDCDTILQGVDNHEVHSFISPPINDNTSPISPDSTIFISNDSNPSYSYDFITSPPATTTTTTTTSSTSLNLTGDSPINNFESLSSSSPPSSITNNNDIDDKNSTNQTKRSSNATPLKRKKTHRRRSSNMNKDSLICFKCQTKTTPEWRKGPEGPATLCNACGLSYAKKLKIEANRKKNQLLPHSVLNNSISSTIAASMMAVVPNNNAMMVDQTSASAPPSLASSTLHHIGESSSSSDSKSIEFNNSLSLGDTLFCQQQMQPFSSSTNSLNISPTPLMADDSPIHIDTSPTTSTIVNSSPPSNNTASSNTPTTETKAKKSKTTKSHTFHQYTHSGSANGGAIKKMPKAKQPKVSKSKLKQQQLAMMNSYSTKNNKAAVQPS